MTESTAERAYKEWKDKLWDSSGSPRLRFLAGFAAAEAPLLARIGELEAAALESHVGSVWHDDPDIRQCRHPTCAALAEQEDAGG
jgi:hypothetical protein